MKLGDTAKLLREELGLTQRAAADHLGISIVHLSNLENDKAKPSSELFRKIRELYGVDLYVFAWCRNGNIDELPAGLRAATERLTREWQKLIAERRASAIGNGG